MKEFLAFAHELSQSGQSFITVTLVGIRGGAPQEIGAKAIITEQGLVWGTVGGGKVEAKAIAYAKEFLQSNQPTECVTWNLQRDVGMTCGGEVILTFEPCCPPQWQIAVFGAGHVSQALVRVLLTLDCSVTCIDSREEWIAKLPQSAKLRTQTVSEPRSVVAQLSPQTFFVVMTQGHATDIPVLEEIFKTHPQALYVGCMGSDVKARRMKLELKEKGVSLEALEKFSSPIGLPIGMNTPAEIAISVAAQLMKVRGANFL
jgi:xanthine dehydrogenase accessory factor